MALCNFEELELTVDQNNEAWDYLSEMQSGLVDGKSDGEQLKKLFNDNYLTFGEKFYIAYIFGRTKDKWFELYKMQIDAE